MTDEKLNFIIPEGQGEVIIRHGDAPKVNEPVAINFSGNLDAPFEFCLDRVPDRNKALFTVVAENKAVLFEEDPTDTLKARVIGQATINPQLRDFGINTTKMFSLKEFIQNIKQYSHLFFLQGNYDRLLLQLNKFSYNQSTAGQKEDNKRGNVVNNFSKNTQIDLLESCLIESNAKFWLESPTLYRELEAQYQNRLASWVDKVKINGYLVLSK